MPLAGWLHAFGGIASVASKAAADYRSWMIEHMKSNVGGVFGYASGLASLSLPVDQSFGARAEGPGARAPKNDDSAAAEAAVASCAKAFEAMTANVNATLDYAERLAEVASPAELVLLSTSQARKQVDLIMEQAAALGALSRSIAGAHGKPGRRAKTATGDRS